MKDGLFLTDKHSRIKKIISYLIGLLIIFFIIYISGVNAIKATFRPLLLPLFFCFLSSILLFLVSSIRWGYITNKIQKEKVCSYFDYFFYFVSGAFSGQYISRIGGDFLLRPLFLNKRNEVAFKKGFLAVLLEKTVDFLFIFILIIPAILYIFDICTVQQIIIIILLILFLTFFLFVFKNQVFILTLKKTCYSLFHFLQKISVLKKLVKESYFVELENLSNFSLLKQRSLFNLFVFTILKYMILIIRIYYLSKALRLNIPMAVLFAGIPIAQLSLIFSFTPGSLGILEGGWYAVFAVVGISNEEISTFLIGQRVYRHIFTSGIFLVTYLAFAVSKLIKSRYSNINESLKAK